MLTLPRTLSRMVRAGAAAAVLVGCGAAPVASAAPLARLRAPIVVAVDASDPGRARVHTQVTIPVAAGGPLALVYPKWIPGEHGPTGPLADVVDLRVTAGGKALAWRRDDVDLYEIVVDVPAGVAAVDVAFDALRRTGGQFSGAAATSPRFVDVVWNQLVVYPKGARAADVAVKPSVRLPAGWAYGTALSVAAPADAQGTVSFAPVTLETLVDSPLVAGVHVKSYDLGVSRGAPHALTVIGETEESVIAPPETVAGWKKLVAEAHALFGARHYDAYRFLLVASDNVSWFGLEHHQSSEDYVSERALTDGDLRRVFAGLLPHEYVHSWNGKYRRPRGLATPSFQEPMKGELLWVYEGLTEYLGWVLSARSGLATKDDALVEAARAVSNLDGTGRSWRPLGDTTTAAQILYPAPSAGRSTRRGTDFYDEGLLMWLEADVIIRQKTNGARSLDDFCARFHGGKDGSPEVRPYDLADVIAALEAVAPYDWKGFVASHVDRVAPELPVRGIEGAGWRVVYTDKKPELVGLREKRAKGTTYWDSLGFYIDEDNVIGDVRDGSPAGKGGLTPGMKLVAIDTRKFSGEVMTDALARAKTGHDPIDVLAERDGFFKTFKVDWHGGERWRTLERDASKPDLLTAILAPKTRP